MGLEVIPVSTFTEYVLSRYDMTDHDDEKYVIAQSDDDYQHFAIVVPSMNNATRYKFTTYEDDNFAKVKCFGSKDEAENAINRQGCIRAMMMSA